LGAGAKKESSKVEVDTDAGLAIKKAVARTLPNFSLKLDEENVSKRLKKTEAQLQAILFTTKASTPNSWKAASAAFRNRVAFYDVQGAACPGGELCTRFHVKKLPAVVATIPGKAPQVCACARSLGRR
jgi:hypothetical protein